MKTYPLHLPARDFAYYALLAEDVELENGKPLTITATRHDGLAITGDVFSVTYQPGVYGFDNKEKLERFIRRTNNATERTVCIAVDASNRDRHSRNQDEADRRWYDQRPSR